MLFSRELKKLSAAQFMEVWEHYDSDGKTKTRDCQGLGSDRTLWSIIVH
jgi:hypothetical protein